MKYVVTGKAVLTVAIMVDADTREEAFEKADGQFEGIRFVHGLWGRVREATVCGAHEFLSKCSKVEFDEACTMEEYECSKPRKEVKRICGGN